MKSRTSSFNLTVLKKDITRFAPVWALYGVFLLMLFSGVDTPRSAARATLGMSVVSFIYAGICASVLFGDLFQSRMCNALHAMPLRREGWFVTHAVSGFLFSFVPNLLATLIIAAVLGEYYYIALIWLAVMTLQYLFFFGAGTFSVMCAGNRLGMFATYGIINLLSLLVYVLVDQFYEPLLFGIQLDTTAFDLFSPLLHMTGTEYVSYSDYGYYNGGYEFFYHGVSRQDFIYLAVCALVGVGLLIGSVALYRRRKLEAAGDFIAWTPLQPVFLVIYTFAIGLLLYGISELFGFGISYVFMAIGILVGYFTGRMLLERTVKVFGRKSLFWFGILVAIFGCSLLLTWLDPLGVTRKIPDTDEIAYVRMFCDDDKAVYLDPDANCVQAESPEEIDQLRNIHQILLEEKNHQTSTSVPIDVHYQLKNGRTVTRYYHIQSLSPVYDTVVHHLSSPEYLFSPDWERLLPNAVVSIWLDASLGGNSKYYSDDTTDPMVIGKLVDAIIADCKAGNMGQYNNLNVGDTHAGWVRLSLYCSPFFEPEHPKEYSYSQISLTVYSSCTNTVKVLEELVQQAEEIRLQQIN